MALVTARVPPIPIGDPMPVGTVGPPHTAPAMDRPKASPKYVPKVRAVQRPRAIAKVISKNSVPIGGGHYKPRGG